MDFELKPVTEPGARVVELAEGHAEDFATRADQHDRDGTFPNENVEAMQKSGLMAATVPEEFGGLGVESVHDVALAMGRLGRGDGSTAIATNMHIFGGWAVTRAWKGAKSRGAAQLVEATETLLRGIGSGGLVTCALGTEPGTDLRHPFTEATRDGDGWLLNGHKIFGTLSPATNLFFVVCRVPDGNGGYHSSFAFVARGTPGMEIKHNWDALGMRGSGSHDVVFENCRITDAALVGRAPCGSWTEQNLEIGAFASLGLVAAFLGIAEAARDMTIGMLKTRKKRGSDRTLAERPSIQHMVGEMETDLAACRAMIARTGLATDAYCRDHLFGSGQPVDELHQVLKDAQCTKWFVNRKAIEIVDCALTLSGGAGYLSKSPLSRMYRDVRAGPFMQPLSPTDALEYIGRVTLGQSPEIEP